jgi:hypothetical protein
VVHSLARVGSHRARDIATYTDARRNTEQIPLRLYLRAKAVAGRARQISRAASESAPTSGAVTLYVCGLARPTYLPGAFAEMQRGCDHLATTTSTRVRSSSEQNLDQCSVGPVRRGLVLARLIEELRE